MSDVRALLDDARQDFTVTGDEFDRTMARARRRSRRQRMIAAATALVVAVAGIGFALWAFRSNAPTRPASLQGNGAIVFVRLADNAAFGGDLYRVNEDGTGLRRLTTSGDVSANISVSPDGSSVAFVRRESVVYVIGTDGTGLKRVAGASHDRGLVVSMPNAQWPSWTPDGKRIRFYTNPGTIEGQTGRPGQGLWEVDVDGSDPRLVIPAWHPWQPAWSPDGTRIAWVGDRGTGSGREDLFVADPDGVHNRRRLTFDPGLVGVAAWSPDGTEIAFSNGSTVEVIGPDGSGRKMLFDCRASCAGLLWLAWSPDGTKIVFTRNSGAILQLWIMSADGTDVHRIPGVSGACCASWQPVAASAAGQQASS
jgi:Tol biopolymer transport system component